MKLLKMLWELFRSHKPTLRHLQIEDLRRPSQYVPSATTQQWTVTLYKDSGIWIEDFQDQVLDGGWVGYEYKKGCWGFFGAVFDTKAS